MARASQLTLLAVLSAAAITDAGAAAAPCLCLFDIDRTLTGKQGDTSDCLTNHVVPGVKDHAYGGGALTLTQLSRTLGGTFCASCYLGTISAGRPGTAERGQLSAALKNIGKLTTDTWNTPGCTVHESPLLTSCRDGTKQTAVPSIQKWYKDNQGANISDKEVYFFDDRSSNVNGFKGFPYNAQQISCASRDGDGEIGLCGATTAEITQKTGVHLCQTPAPRRRRSPAPQPTPAPYFPWRRRRSSPSSRRRRSPAPQPTPAPGPQCKGKDGKINFPVYHIYDSGAGSGLAERNAGDPTGDLSFIFPRGMASYYEHGYIAMLYVSVTKWGKYLHCNHAKGSVKYSCNGGSQEYAGQENAGGGKWYSFPRAGKDKQWSEIDDTHGPCKKIVIKASCLFDLMAKAGGLCDDGCANMDYDTCSKKCVVRQHMAAAHGGGGRRRRTVMVLSLSQQLEVWNDAFSNGKCHNYASEVGDGLNDNLDREGAFMNTSRSEVGDELNDDLDPDGAFANPEEGDELNADLDPMEPLAENPTDTKTAPTDSVVIV